MVERKQVAFKAIWFQGLSADDKKSLENGLKTSLLAERLRTIIDQWERELPETLPDYDKPSWSHRQAHKNGMAEIISRMKSILEDNEPIRTTKRNH